MLLSSLPKIDYFDEPENKTLTKKEKRKLFKTINGGVSIKPITAKTKNQQAALNAFAKNKHLFLYGVAGTGKTFLSLYLALSTILKPENTETYKTVYIYRSAVQTREIGFLGGKLNERLKVYETPYMSICSTLCGRGDAYDILKNKKLVQFESTSFLRGITLSDCLVVIDEVQNMNPHELHSLITRVGENCRLLICGDIRQIDLNSRKEKSGLFDFIEIFKGMDCFETIEFGIDDICRSGFVKDYYSVRTELENKGVIKPL